MKISLARLDTRGLVVDLPGTGAERIAVRAASALRGVVEHVEGRLTITGGAAESLALDALRIRLGELVLSTTTGATLEGLTIALEQHASRLALAVFATSVAALDLHVAVGNVVVSGRITLIGARLSVNDAEGSLAAEQLELAGFSLRIGDIELAAEALSGRAVEIRWGAAGFSLTATSLAGPALHVATGDTRVALRSVHVHALSLDDRQIRIGQVGAESGQLGMTFPPPRPRPRTSAPPPRERSSSLPPPATKSLPPPPRPTPSAPPLIDPRTWNALSGEIDVDVEVDLTVPIIGSRKATHRLRVPIERGTLDYRALENNLSALENALLDFSVRDGALRLERVNPLFPARGHGKPIVVWDLDADDLALAEREHVRLAVLPLARVVGSDADDTEPDSKGSARKSSVALRKLALHRINIRLALAPIDGALPGQGASAPSPLSGRLRLQRIDSFALQGNVVHGPAEPSQPGSVLAELLGLSAAIVGMPLGAANRLDIASVVVAGISPIEMTFKDIRPTNLQLDLAGVALAGVAVQLSASQEPREPRAPS